jgi:hypothetical protein
MANTDFNDTQLVEFMQDMGNNESEIFFNMEDDGTVHESKQPEKKGKQNQNGNNLDLDPSLLNNDEEEQVLLNEDDVPVEIEEKEEKKESNTKVEDKNPKAKGLQFDGKALLQDLKDSELLTIDIPEDFEQTDDNFRKIWTDQLKKDRDELVSYMDEKHNGLLSFLEKGGKLEDFIKVKQEHTYDSINEEDVLSNPSMKEKAYIDYYKRKGLSDSMISRNMKRAQDLDEFNDEVKEILPALKEDDVKIKTKLVEEQKLKYDEQVKQINEFKSNIEKHIDSLTEIVPNKSLSVKDKTKIKELAKSDDIFSKLSKDPIKARTLLATLDYYGILDGKWDSIINDIKTKVTSETKSRYFSGSKPVGGDGGYNATYSSSDTDYSSPVAAFEKMQKKK